MIQDIGKKVRDLRKQKNITLSMLSVQTGLSVGFLSNLERNLSSPTLDNMQKICEVFDISLMQLLNGNRSECSVIRASERESTFAEEGRLSYDAVVFGSGLLDGLVITIQPSSVFEKEWVHGYDEIGIVIEGELRIKIKDEEHQLNVGDCMYIKAKTEHNLSNVSDKVCKSFWVKQITEKHN